MADLLERVRAALAGHYRVERQLGSGGMAVVFRAEDVKHRRTVAVKVLRPELVAAVGAERFLREVEIAARLTHPHILPLLDSGEASGLLYYVMPFVEGESLRKRLAREKQLPLEDALRIAREVADALDHAHRHGVIHRDIKPENILLQEGHGVVADFGIARAVWAAGGEQLTETGVSLGTAAYASPEQASGGHLDGRSDLYSLGCVLYEMLAGEPPFTGPTGESVIRQHLLSPPPDIAAIRPSVPPGLGAVLARMLAKTPADRYPSAAQLGAQLAGTGIAASVPEAARAPRGRLTARWLAGAGVAVVAMLLGAAWLLWQYRAGRGPGAGAKHVIAVFPFAVRAGKEFFYLGEGMVTLLSTTLDGAGDLRCVDPHALLTLVGRQPAGPMDPQRAEPLAARMGAGSYLLGDVLDLRGRLRLDASLYDVGEHRATVRASSEGAAGDITQLVDDLTLKLLAAKSRSRKQAMSRIAMLTTHSVPALKAYLEGERDYFAGTPGVGVKSLQRAVELDSTFALAWYRLSTAAPFAAAGLGRGSELARDASLRAMRQSGRLGERGRSLVLAWHAYLHGRPDEAEGRYRDLVSRHPDDLEAWGKLSLVAYHVDAMRGRSIVERRLVYERLATLDPEDPAIPYNLATIALLEGRRREADSLLRRSLALAPGAAEALVTYATLAFSLGDSAASDSLAARLLRPGSIGLMVALGDHHLYSGSLDRVRGLALRYVQARGAHGWTAGGLLGADLDLAGGRWASARMCLREAAQRDPIGAAAYAAAWAASPFLPVSRELLDSLRLAIRGWDASRPIFERTRLTSHAGAEPQLKSYLLGLLAARMGDERAALAHAEEIERADGSGEAAVLGPDWAHGLRATVLWKRGRNAEAMAQLERCRMELWPMPLTSFRYRFHERYLRGELLFSLGRHAEALGWFAGLVESGIHSAPYLGPSHLRRAQIYERLGRSEEAIRHYGRFIELWEGCDPELRPQLDDARRRREALLARQG